MKTLYLFTTQYPYSTPESFLEEEIIYLSKKFDKVVILPFRDGKANMRMVPDNCEVVNIPLSSDRLKYNVCGVFHYKTAAVLTKEFFRSRVFMSGKRLKAWVSSARFLNNCLFDKKLQTLLKNLTKDDVCYFYWGTGQCLLSILLKGKVHLVSRFHGFWDLWEESYGGFHSLRSDVAHSLDKAIFIARKGEEYFKQRYPYASTAVYPLGTKDHGVQLDNPNDGIVRVISCSKIYPLKRVPLIFEALNSLTDYKIEWTHIGDGPDFERLKELIKEEKKEHISVILPGRMPNNKVLDYYSKHHFDMFVNMSTTEGVPVAIMEASSFGIPILATDVGSTSEEVPTEVGELLPANPTVTDICNKIRKLLRSSYNPRAFWSIHYNADKNYSDFAEMLYNL